MGKGEVVRHTNGASSSLSSSSLYTGFEMLLRALRFPFVAGSSISILLSRTGPFRIDTPAGAEVEGPA